MKALYSNVEGDQSPAQSLMKSSDLVSPLVARVSHTMNRKNSRLSYPPLQEQYGANSYYKLDQGYLEQFTIQA